MKDYCFNSGVRSHVKCFEIVDLNVKRFEGVGENGLERGKYSLDSTILL